MVQGMPKFETIRHVKHTPQNMFDLVADIEKYPEFVPLCKGLHIQSKRDVVQKTLIIANMSVGYKAISETFTSQVLLDKEQLRIEVSYLDGPFEYLNNIWTFNPHESGSDVVFFIDYAFKSKMLGVLMGSMFDTAFRKFSQAFEERADKIYSNENVFP
jgi:coenzyme Q-binding protein COQ10